MFPAVLDLEVSRYRHRNIVREAVVAAVADRLDRHESIGPETAATGREQVGLQRGAVVQIACGRAPRLRCGRHKHMGTMRERS